MMIKSSLHLIFVLPYKSAYLWSEPEKMIDFGGCFVLFTELLIYLCFNLFFLSSNFPVIRENGNYFTVILVRPV